MYWASRGQGSAEQSSGEACELKRADTQLRVDEGHGDFRQLTDLPRTIGGMLARMEQIGLGMIADSPDEVRLRAREQLMQGPPGSN